MFKNKYIGKGHHDHRKPLSIARLCHCGYDINNLTYNDRKYRLYADMELAEYTGVRVRRNRAQLGWKMDTGG